MRCIKAACIYARLEIKVMASNQSNGESSKNARDFDLSASQVDEQSSANLNEGHH
jgi:hypothetical protein